MGSDKKQKKQQKGEQLVRSTQKTRTKKKGAKLPIGSRSGLGTYVRLDISGP